MEAATSVLAIKKEKNDFLKLVGILAMAVDHIGLVFFPQITGLRIIGRLALPIFAAGIADGYRYTKDLKKYIARLIVFGLISQIPYIVLFEKYNLNIFFTLALSLILIYSVDKKNYLLSLATLVISFFVKVDYGIYGVVLAALFYFFRANKIWQLVSLTVVTLVYCYFQGYLIQLYAVIGFLLAIYFPNDEIKMTLPKHFFYWFYPVHLAIIIIIKQFV